LGPLPQVRGDGGKRTGQAERALIAHSTGIGPFTRGHEHDARLNHHQGHASEHEPVADAHVSAVDRIGEGEPADPCEGPHDCCRDQRRNDPPPPCSDAQNEIAARTTGPGKRFPTAPTVSAIEPWAVPSARWTAAEKRTDLFRRRAGNSLLRTQQRQRGLCRTQLSPSRSVRSRPHRTSAGGSLIPLCEASRERPFTGPRRLGRR
jgi:hypothetical protein